MVAYSFHPQFVPKILAGEKTHTIRAHRMGRARHAQAGDKLQLFTGPRMKPKRLGAAVCLATRPICLDFERNQVRVTLIDKGGGPDAIPVNLVVDRKGLDAFAVLDGFNSWDQMRAFWLLKHGAIGAWYGSIIYWKDFTPENGK